MKGDTNMTKEMLDSYKSKKAEIQELNHTLAHLHEGDNMIGNSTIFDYRSGYPVPQSVVGVDWDKFDSTREKCNKRIRALEKECKEVEEFIENIPDSLTRRIFRMYFMQGLSQKAISEKISMERSSVSKKINMFLESFTQFT